MPKKIKVLHFVSNGKIGGQERATYQLVRALRHDEQIKLSVAFTKNEGLYIEKIKDLGIPYLFLKIKNGFSLNFDRNRIKELKDFHIHHLHDPSPNTIIYSLLAGRKVRRVFTRRGGMAEYSIFNQKKRIKFLIKKMLIKNSFDGFSGNSLNAVKSLKEQYKINKDVTLLYNGIYFNLLDAKGSPENLVKSHNLHDCFVVGSVGRLVKLKRIDLLIRCFSKIDIKKKKLLVIGSGVEIQNLKQLAKSLGVEREVVFVGEVQNIQDFYPLFDCFVLPSNNRESFGNAVVEAMYHKIPSIIMADSDGLKEHITDNETGYIAKNEIELISCIEHIYRNKDDLNRIGEKAFEYVTKKYSVQSMVDEYRKFYLQVLKQ